MSTRGCRCGWTRKRPMTLDEIKTFSKLRGYSIIVCKLCRHEVGPLVKAHDVRTIYPFGGSFVHRVCAEHFGLVKPRKRRETEQKP